MVTVYRFICNWFLKSDDFLLILFNYQDHHSRSVDSMCKNCGGLNSQQGSMAAKIRDSAGKQSIMHGQDQRQQDDEVSKPKFYIVAIVNVVTN